MHLCFGFRSVGKNKKKNNSFLIVCFTIICGVHQALVVFVGVVFLWKMIIRGVCCREGFTQMEWNSGLKKTDFGQSCLQLDSFIEL